jgi:YcxB-like protein
MQVVVTDIRRSDWVRAIAYMFVRLRANWIMFGIALVAFLVFACILMAITGPVTRREVAIAAVFAVAGAVSTLLLGLLAHLASTAAMARTSRLLDAFTLTLGDDGLHTQSAAGQGMLKWSAVAFVRSNKNYIFIGVTPYKIILVPLRNFPSPQELDQFWVRISDLWRASAQQNML